MPDVIPITPTRKDEMSSPGLGRARCYVCGEPVVEHAIGPCPRLNDPNLRTSYSARFKQIRATRMRAGLNPYPIEREDLAP